MTPKMAEYLVYVHSNICLLSRNSSKYKEEKTKFWDITGEDFSLDDNRILKIVSLSLNEPELEVVFVNEDEMLSFVRFSFYKSFSFYFFTLQIIL